MKLISLASPLRVARKTAGFKTAKAFLKIYHIPASTYSQHELGARTSDPALKLYAKIFGANFGWLKTGKGKLFKKIMSFKKKTFAKESIVLTF